MGSATSAVAPASDRWINGWSQATRLPGAALASAVPSLRCVYAHGRGAMGYTVVGSFPRLGGWVSYRNGGYRMNQLVMNQLGM